MDDGFLCQVRADGDLVVATVRGDVDLSVAETLADDLEVWLKPSVRLVVDCAGVAFIDSIGLRALIKAAQTADLVGADFALAAPSSALTRVLTLSGLANVFTVLEGVPAN